MLYLGALGDRYGRKLMLMLGMALSVPACLLAACAPTDEVLFVARIFGGLVGRHGLPDHARADHRAVVGARPDEVDRAVVGARRRDRRARARCSSGLLLEHFWWGSVFLVTLPLAVVAFVMAVVLVPRHVNEATEPVDNLGGILSVVLVAALVLAINFAPVPNKGALVLGLGGDRPGGAGRVLHPPAAGRQPALRPATSRRAGSSGSRPWPASSSSAR